MWLLLGDGRNVSFSMNLTILCSLVSDQGHLKKFICHRLTCITVVDWIGIL